MRNNSALLSQLILVLSTVLLFSCSEKEQKHYRIQNGYFKQSITETGYLRAIKSTSINMPKIGYRYGGSYKIVDIAEHGSMVQKGDTVIKIDQSQVLKYIVNTETDYERQKASQNKMLVNHKNSIKSLETSIKTTEAEFEMKKLQMERSKFEPKNKQRILELEFQQSQIRLKKAYEKIELKRSINKNEMRIMELRLQQTKSRIDKAYSSLDRFYITTPQDGLFVIEENRRTQKIYKIGDEVHIGREVATVPDLSLMKIKSYINETDIKNIYMGQKVDFRLDAYPRLKFEGHISYIGRLSRYRRGSTIKTFDIEIEVDGKDERLKPGMTVNCEIIYAESNNENFISNKCIYREKGNHFLFVKKRNSIEKIPIEIGARNSSSTVIKSEINPKSKVLPYERALSQLNS